LSYVLRGGGGKPDSEPNGFRSAASGWGRGLFLNPIRRAWSGVGSLSRWSTQRGAPARAAQAAATSTIILETHIPMSFSKISLYELQRLQTDEELPPTILQAQVWRALAARTSSVKRACDFLFHIRPNDDQPVPRGLTTARRIPKNFLSHPCVYRKTLSELDVME